MSSSTVFWSAGVGFFLGFAFGIGCALAVMFSIYMGGYRAAIRDARMAEPSERYLTAVKKVEAKEAAKS